MITIQENVPLAEHSNYRIGGPARWFAHVGTEDELAEAVRAARERNAKMLVLGGGTNFLFSDDGFPGFVLRIELGGIEVEGEEIRVGAGIPMHELVAYAATHGLSGLEWAGGLPGTVGGAIRGNAGAFGGETKDNVVRVRSYAVAEEEWRERANAECKFGYRTSIFKEDDGAEIITSGTFHFAHGDVAAIAKAVDEKVAYRNMRHPMEQPNIGSIFKNVPVERVPAGVMAELKPPVKEDPFPVVPAAVLIAAADCKGMREGQAQVSEKHPNFIVNLGGATAADVRALMRRVQEAVKEKFTVDLEPEVIVI